jgi:nucleoside-diphosphate-sugar epimerase
MEIYENDLYRDDVKRVATWDLPWEKMVETSVLISGATGLIGSFFVDVIMYRNKYFQMNCKLYALGRDEKKAKIRFAYCYKDPLFLFTPHDINIPLSKSIGEVDYVLHLASNTHPIAYSMEPINTITTNIIGLKNMLDASTQCRAKRFVFSSSNEIYGENRGDKESFDESYCGYIDCNTLRAGYPESKRCGEALCQAYKHQNGLDIVIPRLTRSYGPTMMESDTKAISQFIKNAVRGENIVLKSAGDQYYSYTYVADAVSGLLTVLLRGKSGEAYNIADISSDIRLKDLADILARISNKKVVFEIPDAVETAGYSKATKARIDGSKVKELGWNPLYDMEHGLSRTVEILKKIGNLKS